MPRLPQHDEPASELIHIRVTPAQKSELVQVAKENGLPVTTVIREAVNTFVADYREGEAVFRDTKRSAA